MGESKKQQIISTNLEPTSEVTHLIEQVKNW